MVVVAVDDNYLIRVVDDGDDYHLVACFEMNFSRLDSSFQIFSEHLIDRNQL